MTLDELVTTLREEHQNFCNYLTDLDHATTALYEPGGTIKEVKRALWDIDDAYNRAFIAVDKYQEEHPELKD